MKIILLNSNTETKFQSFYENITVNGENVRARFELRWLEATNKWYVSVFNSLTGESLCRYVPLVSCDLVPNDLLSPFSYKKFGEIYCAHVVEEHSSEDPQEKNLAQFGVVWGGPDAE